MIAGADLIVSARLDGRCIGMARCLTDFAWVAYCGDLAVHDEFQGRGIGLGLLASLPRYSGRAGRHGADLDAGRGRLLQQPGTESGSAPCLDAYFMKRRRGI